MDIEIIPVFLLGLSIILIWSPSRFYWLIPFSLSLIISILIGTQSWGSLVPIFFLLLGCVALTKEQITGFYRFALVLMLSILIFAIGLHVVPGFANWPYARIVLLSEHSAAFSIWFNLDKPLIGLFILASLHDELIKTIQQFAQMLKSMWKPLVIGILFVYMLAMLLGYAKVDITFVAVFFPWAIKNLVFTVIAEEAFFRGLIQRQIHRYTNLPQPFYGIVIAGVLFGIAHFAGGTTYVLLASVAGCLYGYVYWLTGRIEAAILTHFSLNAGHFLFFTYPYLQ